MLQVTALPPLMQIDLLSPSCSVSLQDRLSAGCEPNAAVLERGHLAQHFTTRLIISLTRIDLYSTSFLPLTMHLQCRPDQEWQRHSDSDDENSH